MDALFPIIIVFTVLIILKSLSGKVPKKGTIASYQKIPFLLTKAEMSFYGILLQTVKDEFTVFPKVRVADVLKPGKGLNRSQWKTAFNRISSKHFDFVLCDPKTKAIKGVVELNDKSHQAASRQERDSFIRTICQSAELPLYEISAKRGYSIDELRKIIIPELNRLNI